MRDTACSRASWSIAESASRDGLLSSWVLGKNKAAAASATSEEQPMEDSTADRSLTHRSNAPSNGFFRVPGLFVRLSSKGLNLNHAVDPDSVWSPTSPLDFKNLPSSIGSTGLRSPGAPSVGLGLVDALAADESSLKLSLKDSFLESIRPYLELGLPKPDSNASVNVDGDADAAGQKKNGSAAAGVSVTLSDISDLVHSEEYTCVIEHGPNPRTTHILGDETLEVVVREGGGVLRLPGGSRKPVFFTIEPIVEQTQPPLPSSTPAAAGSRCCSCRKRLEEDRDIYMYLGEKAFCSNECRKGFIEEEIEEVELMMLEDSGVASASALHLDEDCW